MNNIPNIIFRFIPILSTIGIVFYSYYNKIENNKNIDKKKVKIKISKIFYNKMYKTIYYKSDLDKDPYKRELDKNVVKKFCIIANSLDINNDTEITDKLFDEIYKKYVEYQLSTLNNK